MFEKIIQLFHDDMIEQVVSNDISIKLETVW